MPKAEVVRISRMGKAERSRRAGELLAKIAGMDVNSGDRRLRGAMTRAISALGASCSRVDSRGRIYRRPLAVGAFREGFDGGASSQAGNVATTAEIVRHEETVDFGGIEVTLVYQEPRAGGKKLVS